MQVQTIQGSCLLLLHNRFHFAPNCTKITMPIKVNHSNKIAMKMLAAQNKRAYCFVLGSHLAQYDLITNKTPDSEEIEERLRATEETLKETEERE